MAASPEIDDDDGLNPQPWMVVGFVIMSIYLGLLGGGAVYGFIKDSRDDTKIDALIASNRRNAEIAHAEVCISNHEQTSQVREAIGITPDALIEVSGDEADPAEVEEFLAAIQTRINATIKAPACDLDKAREDFERLGGEP